MARVYVLGGAGSGKTTVAALLGKQLGCPVVHLDFAWAAVDWDAQDAQVEQHGAREAVVQEQAAREAWVIEGNYPGWIQEFAARADVVVWLDVPFRVAAWRIVRRHLLAELRGDNPYPGYRRLWRFLRNQHAYYGDTEAAYRQRLARNPDRWSGALYGRAAVAAHAAAMGSRLLRVTRGRRGEIARAALALASGTVPLGR
jgi:adenylate kinase family enzyme